MNPEKGQSGENEDVPSFPDIRDVEKVCKDLSDGKYDGSLSILVQLAECKDEKIIWNVNRQISEKLKRGELDDNDDFLEFLLKGQFHETVKHYASKIVSNKLLDGVFDTEPIRLIRLKNCSDKLVSFCAYRRIAEIKKDYQEKINDFLDTNPDILTDYDGKNIEKKEGIWPLDKNQISVVMKIMGIKSLDIENYIALL